METDRAGHALAVLRDLPGAIVAAIEVAREEGRQEGIAAMRDALLRGAPGGNGRPAHRPAKKAAKKPRPRVVAPP